MRNRLLALLNVLGCFAVVTLSGPGSVSAYPGSDPVAAENRNPKPSRRCRPLWNGHRREEYETRIGDSNFVPKIKAKYVDE
jgi:hypothetical protein